MAGIGQEFCSSPTFSFEHGNAECSSVPNPRAGLSGPGSAVKASVG